MLLSAAKNYPSVQSSYYATALQYLNMAADKAKSLRYQATPDGHHGEPSLHLLHCG